MHEGSQQYWETPRRIGETEHPPLEPAHQARARSLND
jgi:hypothetical protein